MNPKLKQYEAGIEENIKPEDKDAYDRIVTSGANMINDDEFDEEMMAILSAEGELADKIADGVARLVSVLHVSSQGKMPIGPTIAASYTFMIYALDIAERRLGEKITDDIIADTALKTISVVGPLLGITKEKLQAAMQGQSEAQPEMPAPEAPAQPTKPMGLMQQSPMNGGI